MNYIKIKMENKHQTEIAALTFMSFVMSEAAEILLEKAFKENNFTANDLRHEEKMYFKMFVDGLKKMKNGIQGFNQKTIDKYFKFDRIDETDEIRKQANDLIRLYCYTRNTIGPKSDFTVYEEKIKSMQREDKAVIKPETIEKFVLL
jgi:hypothetical protein